MCCLHKSWRNEDSHSQQWALNQICITQNCINHKSNVNKINKHIDICNLTSPYYFTSLKKHYQRPDLRRAAAAAAAAEASYLEVGDVGNHVCKQGVTGYVEGHTKAHVCRPLVQLAWQLPIGHIELAEAVAGWEGHFVDVSNIPGTHDDASVIWVVLDGVNDLKQKGKTFYLILQGMVARWVWVSSPGNDIPRWGGFNHLSHNVMPGRPCGFKLQAAIRHV